VAGGGNSVDVATAFAADADAAADSPDDDASPALVAPCFAHAAPSSATRTPTVIHRSPFAVPWSALRGGEGSSGWVAPMVILTLAP
jgi:hypothetical protein